jgi:hypothetical protein
MKWIGSHSKQYPGHRKRFLALGKKYPAHTKRSLLHTKKSPRVSKSYPGTRDSHAKDIKNYPAADFLCCGGTDFLS